jgi:hypothetical protein
MAAPAAVISSSVRAICPAISNHVEMLPADRSSHSPSALLHRLADFRPRYFQSREQAKENAGLSVPAPAIVRNRTPKTGIEQIGPPLRSYW